MTLINEKNKAFFNLDAISCGCLIRAKHVAWNDYKNGIVTAAKDSAITVFYCPDIGNVTRYFTIDIKDVQDGQWGILWAHDFSEIYTYGPSTEAAP